MRVYMATAVLLKGDVFAITSSDGRDSIIVDNEAYDLIIEFFTIEYCIDWWDRWKDKIEHLYHYRPDTKEFWLCNKCAVKNIDRFRSANSFVYRGNIFMDWEIEVEDDIWQVYLGVFTVDGDFVGSVSKLGGVSTPELARLIIQRPELDWEV